MTIRLHNTMTRQVEEFTPIDPTNVRMYVCGPTVYDRAHLGNARPVVVFDTLFRLLRHTYGPEHVTYVRNFTDVDDKINARAAERGVPISAVTEETIEWYHQDMEALGTLRPTHEPRATGFIPQMVAMIEGLIASGHAYAAEGHVLFRVRSYSNYGRLSGRSVDDMIAGARVEVAPFKEDPMDFVLWKPSEAGEPAWAGPKVDGVEVSKGRPGWHIECSAMADELLMNGLPEDKKSFDIHAGGLDLQFPHHENEIAQSMCAHPHGHFAKVWMHNEMLQVEGKKMSKSLGNFFTVRDLLDQGIPGEVIRFVLLSTHYRSPMDWTKEKARQAQETLVDWYEKAAHVEPDEQGRWAVVPHLQKDLDTSGALTAIGALARDPMRYPELRYAMEWMGFGFPDRQVPQSLRSESREDVGAYGTVHVSWSGDLDHSLVRLLTDKGHELLALRASAIDTKDYGPPDELKKLLISAGVTVSIAKNVVSLALPTDVDQAKLEALK